MRSCRGLSPVDAMDSMARVYNSRTICHAPRAYRGCPVARVVVYDSAIVVDDLDVVPVGVEDERAVVARVVHGALAGPAVVLVSGGERGGVEGPHRGVVPGGEGEVDVLRERPLV